MSTKTSQSYMTALSGCRASEVKIMENYLDDVLWVGDVTGNFSSKVLDLPYYFRFDSDSKGPVRGCR